MQGQEVIDHAQKLIELAEAGDEVGIRFWRIFIGKVADTMPLYALVRVAKCLRDCRIDELIDEKLGRGDE